MSWKAKAPSNIALIKYMGKTDPVNNIPSNPSISLTLDNLVTVVTAEKAEEDNWQPLVEEGLLEQVLSEKGKARYLNNWKRLKERLNVQGNFTLRSASNFPSDCGIASSASSFAALTKLANKIAYEQSEGELQVTDGELALLSQKASGSSCRSFFSPWCIWDDNGVSPISLEMKSYFHQLVVVSDEKKEVSSSEAHKRVESSPLFEGRSERAIGRLNELVMLMQHDHKNNWQKIFQIVWDEFIDMHELFHTSEPGFRYRTKESDQALESIQSFWQKNGDGPLVTMDAGANIHLIFRTDQKEIAEKLQQEFNNNFKVICSERFH